MSTSRKRQPQPVTSPSDQPNPTRPLTPLQPTTTQARNLPFLITSVVLYGVWSGYLFFVALFR